MLSSVLPRHLVCISDDVTIYVKIKQPMLTFIRNNR